MSVQKQNTAKLIRKESSQQKLYKRQIQHRQTKKNNINLHRMALAQQHLIDPNITFHPKISQSKLSKQNFDNMVIRYKATKLCIHNNTQHVNRSASRQKLQKIKQKSLQKFSKRYSRARIQNQIKQQLLIQPLNYCYWHHIDRSPIKNKTAPLSFKPLLSKLLSQSKKII